VFLFITVCVLIFIGCFSCSNERSSSRDTSDTNDQDQEKSILRSTLAGSWYTDDANDLKKQLAGFFKDTHAEANAPIGLILPHAGYQYSGRIAAQGLGLIDRPYKRIVVIGPSHRVALPERLSVPTVSHYETPLGRVALDGAFIRELLKHDLFCQTQAHQYEHSVQIEVPLLQYRFKDFKLVPVVAGQCSLGTIERVAGILRGLIDKDTLVIASSDFTHYGPNYGYVPFHEDIPKMLEELDMGAYACISKLDVKGLWEYKQRTGATICGCVPVMILMAMMDASTTRVQRVAYTTSGHLTGDYTNSVSYLCVAFFGQWPQTAPMEPNEPQELSAEQRSVLLSLARKTLIYYLQHSKTPEPTDLGITVAGILKQPRAAFVTLTKQGQLRGCIGDIMPHQPLYQSVINNAVNAAIHDPRFRPVHIEECNDITLEISVLTVPRPVASYRDIRIGTDGVILQKYGRSAVFLPQVAPEQGWDLEQTLTHLSQKAGLPPDAWKEKADFLTFQAEVFGEEP
jgi:AmmeMemoRadiSam system protein B/AmmeMemoRadiSam system protein A